MQPRPVPVYTSFVTLSQYKTLNTAHPIREDSKPFLFGPKSLVATKSNTGFKCRPVTRSHPPTKISWLHYAGTYRTAHGDLIFCPPRSSSISGHRIESNWRRLPSQAVFARRRLARVRTLMLRQSLYTCRYIIDDLGDKCIRCVCSPAM